MYVDYRNTYGRIAYSPLSVGPIGVSVAEVLQYAAEQLIVELRRNVETFMASWNDPEVIVTANGALGGAAQKYADVLFKLTGWGNPLVLQEDDGIPRETDFAAAMPSTWRPPLSTVRHGCVRRVSPPSATEFCSRGPTIRSR